MLSVIGVFSVLGAFAQIKKHYTVTDTDQFDKIDLSLSTASGTSYIRPTPNRNPVNIYGEANPANKPPTCKSTLSDRTQHIKVYFDDEDLPERDANFNFNVFKTSSDVKKDQWHVYLSQNKPIKLDLDQGMGRTFLDLSGMNCERLNISSGSADVNISYADKQYNKSQMDTFCIKVDMGALVADHLTFSKAENVIADVGFGSASLDFSGMNLVRSNVDASVGVGNLVIYVPDVKNPTIIHIKDTPLCRVKLPDYFSEIKSNVFVNPSYREDAENLVTFNLDVAVGNILFKEK